jgi:hypothetical protein
MVMYGRVTDGVTDVAQPAVSLEASWRSPTSGREERRMARTDFSGEYSLCGLQPGSTVSFAVTVLGGRATEEEVTLSQASIQFRDFSIDIGESGAIRGFVLDAETGAGISSAEVSIRGTRYHAITGSSGEFVIDGLEQGEYLLEMEHLAYGRQTQSITLGSRNVLVEARFSQEAIQLQGITVSVLQPRLENEGFYTRRRRHSATDATHLTGEELMQRDSTSLPWALRNVWSTELRMSSEKGPILQHRSRGATCDMPIFLDGMLMLGFFNLGSLRPSEILAVEVYPPQAPAPPLLPDRFRNRSDYPGCGGVLIWTR